MSQSHNETVQSSPIMAPDNPWEIDPKIACQIRCTAAWMIGKTGLMRQDRGDLEQELTLQLLARMPQFDPSRASLMTFVARVLNSAAVNIIAARQMEKRHWRAGVCSLDTEMEIEDGSRVPVAELLDANLRESKENARVQREQMQLRLDVERVMATLSEKEREVCRLLIRKNSGQAARRLGLPRATFYDMTIKLRERFAAAGLKKYL